MENIKTILEEVLNHTFVTGVLSGPKSKAGFTRVKIRPILKKEQLYFQCEKFRNNQAFHENIEEQEICEALLTMLQEFKQMQLETKEYSYHILVSKKGKATIQKKQQKSTKQVHLAHNREKQYILKEGMQIPFLQDLGVMSAEGIVKRSKWDKFRQINRFLEFIEDVLPKLPREKTLTILDFGCGKSYLTFAMYYYLHEMQGYDIQITGLDLKQEVIEHCNELSKKYGYGGLHFLKGDIVDYEGVDSVDMVVTLHACDTATDYALYKAINWRAKVILSVPCCQHELNKQIQNEVLKPVLSYGILKERMAALVTDGLRAEYLKQNGYDTQILEFIDMEHTPKNLLIRGVKMGDAKDNREVIQACEEFLGVKPKLGELLSE